MDIWEADKLALFLAFVIPGFLSLKTYAVLGLRGGQNSSQQIIDAVAFSCINYALLAWPILKVEASTWKTTSPNAYLAFYAFVILVAPVLWGTLWWVLRRTGWAQCFLPHPTEKPWDFVFGQRQSYWIVVTLDDGKKIGGLYSSNSFVSTAPASEQIYLEETWHLNEDGGFDRRKTDTAGTLILGATISTIEFFQQQPGETNGNEADTPSTQHEGMEASACTGTGQGIGRLPAHHQQDTSSPTAQKAVSRSR